MAITIGVNGVDRTIDVDADTPLLWVLRDVLGMTGTKFGCGMALCGACTVHVDGVATRSCITAVGECRQIPRSRRSRRSATTPAGARIQKAWLDREVVQCGYCQSGQIMSASALLASNPHPTDADIDDAMSGNICRCGTYVPHSPSDQAGRAIERTRKADNDASIASLPALLTRTSDRRRFSPGADSAGRRGRRRRPDAEPELAVRTTRSRSGRRRRLRAKRLHPHRAATGRSS